jgi:hypothetical protein
VRSHARGLRIGAVVLAVLAFVFLEQPTGVAILVIAALLLVGLAVIESVVVYDSHPYMGRRGT